MIEGEIKNGSDLLITIDLMNPNEFVSVDSVRCDANGKFAFSFPGVGLNFYSLKYTDDGYITVIAEPGDKIYIKGNAESIYPYEIIGSEASDLLRELAESHKQVLDQLIVISNESNNLMGDADFSEKKLILNKRFDSITDNFHDYSQDFILSNPASPAILIALYNQFGPENPVFHPIDDFEIYRFFRS